MKKLYYWKIKALFSDLFYTNSITTLEYLICTHPWTAINWKGKFPQKEFIFTILALNKKRPGGTCLPILYMDTYSIHHLCIWCSRVDMYILSRPSTYLVSYMYMTKARETKIFWQRKPEISIKYEHPNYANMYSGVPNIWRV